jgi:alkanesulfonate monooxygenase SsuD/methylene tetrahydromethanopterin reductase-like flavin-dependent oxidoreductase (luciferase family)
MHRAWTKVQLTGNAAVDIIADASRRGDSERTLAAIPDEMVPELTASGTAADLRAQIAEYRRSGIALPILMPVQSGPDSMAGVVETLRAGAA